MKHCVAISIFLSLMLGTLPTVSATQNISLQGFNSQLITQQVINLSRLVFSDPSTNIDISALEETINGDVSISVQDRMRAYFYSSLPRGHYAAVYLDQAGNEKHWQTLGNPFAIPISHFNVTRLPIVEADEAEITLDIPKIENVVSIKFGVRRDNEIVFLDQTIDVSN